MKKISFLLIATFFITLLGCKKGPGEGGNSSISGKIWVQNYNSSFTTITSEYAGADEDVYIIYGNDVSYGEKISASPDGSFEFKYLRPGDYTIYVYSKDKTLTAPSGTIAIKKAVTISSKKEKVDAGTITIYN